MVNKDDVVLVQIPPEYMDVWPIPWETPGIVIELSYITDYVYDEELDEEVPVETDDIDEIRVMIGENQVHWLPINYIQKVDI